MSLKSPTDLSYAERKQAVRIFIVALYQNQMHIKTYHRLAMFLNENRIKLLRPLEKSGEQEHYDKYGIDVLSIDRWYTDEDAEKYFEWLVAVVNDTENVGDDVKKQAYDQLFRFLYVMREDIEKDKNIQLIAPYDWQNLFTSFNQRLTDMQRIIDRGNKDIIEVLKPLSQMVNKNVAMMKKLCDENERFFGKDDVDVKPNQ